MTNEEAKSLNAFERPFRCRRQEEKSRYRGERQHAELVTLAGGKDYMSSWSLWPETILKSTAHRQVQANAQGMPKMKGKGEARVPHRAVLLLPRLLHVHHRCMNTAMLWMEPWQVYCGLGRYGGGPATARPVNRAYCRAVPLGWAAYQFESYPPNSGGVMKYQVLYSRILIRGMWSEVCVTPQPYRLNPQ